MKIENLADVIKSAQSGDSAAIESLYNEHAKSVYFLALKLLESPQDAEDVTQEVFLYAFQKLGELQAPEAFPSWLNRITSSKCTDFLRKKRPTVSISDEEATDLEFEETDRNLIPDVKLDQEETARIIIEIVDKLPLPQRVCVYYYYYEQLSIKEIAERLAVSENTVSSRLRLARDKIRVELENLEGEEGLKLYMASPLILIPLLGMLSQNTELPANLLARITSQLNLSASAASANTATSTVTVDTATNATVSTATTSVIPTKVIMGIVASVVVVMGVVLEPV
jgi:RNA polymerase sigma factor (sigma-70 family)